MAACDQPSETLVEPAGPEDSVDASAVLSALKSHINDAGWRSFGLQLGADPELATATVVDTAGASWGAELRRSEPGSWTVAWFAPLQTPTGPGGREILASGEDVVVGRAIVPRTTQDDIVHEFLFDPPIEDGEVILGWHYGINAIEDVYWDYSHSSWWTIDFGGERWQVKWIRWKACRDNLQFDGSPGQYCEPNPPQQSFPDWHIVLGIDEFGDVGAEEVYLHYDAKFLAPPDTSVNSIALSPPAVFVEYGGTELVTATPKTESGGTVTGKTVSWATGNSAIASVETVDPTTAEISGHAIGTTTLTATVGGVQETATVTVDPTGVALTGPTSGGANELVTIAATPIPDAGSYFYQWSVEECNYDPYRYNCVTNWIDLPDGQDLDSQAFRVQWDNVTVEFTVSLRDVEGGRLIATASHLLWGPAEINTDPDCPPGEICRMSGEPPVAGQ